MIEVVAIFCFILIFACRFAASKFLRHFVTELKMQNPDRFYKITEGRDFDYLKNGGMLSISDHEIFTRFDKLLSSGELNDAQINLLFNLNIYISLFYLKIISIILLLIYFAYQVVTIIL